MNTKNIEVGQTLYLPIERSVRFVPCIIWYKEIKEALMVLNRINDKG